MSQMNPPRDPMSTRALNIRIRRFSPVLAGAGLALTLLLPACGGDDGGTPTQPTQTPQPTPPPGPSQANITIDVTNATRSTSIIPGFAYDLVFTLTVTESAGLGANFNFIRAEFYDGTGRFVERQEISAAQLGQVPPSQSLSAQVRIGFNAAPTRGNFVILTCSFTDFRNNNLTPTIRLNFV